MRKILLRRLALNSHLLVEGGAGTLVLSSQEGAQVKGRERVALLHLVVITSLVALEILIERVLRSLNIGALSVIFVKVIELVQVAG